MRFGTKAWAVLWGVVAHLAGVGSAHAVGLIGLQPFPGPVSGGGETDILSIETEPFSASFLGSAAFPKLSGLDAQPGTGVLFASSGAGDGGRLFTLDPATGAATLVGDAEGFDRLPGLAFDLDGTLFASAGGVIPTELVTLDPATGVGSPVGPFAADAFIAIDGLAIHPLTGELFGFGLVCENALCFGAFTTELFLVDKATGFATSQGILTEAGTGQPLACCPAGLAFDPEGNLFASTGSGDGRILAIDPSGPAPSYAVLGDTGDRSISDIVVVPEPSRLWLALVALGALGAGRLRGQPGRVWSLET